jgi:hypothetical protein
MPGSPLPATATPSEIWISLELLGICCARMVRIESRTNFASNGIRGLKLPLGALITAKNSFR